MIALWDESADDLIEQIADHERRATMMRMKAVAYEREGETAAADGCDVYADAAQDEASRLRDRLAEIEEEQSLREDLSDRAWARMGWL